MKRETNRRLLQEHKLLELQTSFIFFRCTFEPEGFPAGLPEAF